MHPLQQMRETNIGESAFLPADLVMTPAADVLREGERLSCLDRYDVLDTPPEAAFDRIRRLARKLADTPIAIVSFIDGHRQWYKSFEGLDVSEVRRDETFCRYTIAQAEPLVVTDAETDARFARHPAVIGPPHVRAYPGVPLRSRDG